uniref:Uncharacterized protein n=1 Tax=Ascaris lumbricoides TaxID=6252 RepID=A0A0M3HYS1_ASCLU
MLSLILDRIFQKFTERMPFGWPGLAEMSVEVCEHSDSSELSLGFVQTLLRKVSSLFDKSLQNFNANKVHSLFRLGEVRGNADALFECRLPSINYRWLSKRSW